VPDGRSPSSLAWAGLGNTYFWIDPTKSIAGVILMQPIPFADPKALGLLDSFEKAVYAALGLALVTGSPVPERAGSPLLGASRS
jgi:methyl acetate hydrolase